MPRNPENYSAGDYEDEETEYQYDWSNYEERVRHVEIHLDEFVFLAEAAATTSSSANRPRTRWNTA